MLVLKIAIAVTVMVAFTWLMAKICAFNEFPDE
jgi:hypothetical protein